MPKSASNATTYVVIWQSLVLEAYRSFFYKLADADPNAQIYLIIPQRFKEGGNQLIECQPDKKNHPRVKLLVSPSWNLHVQIVFYWKLCFYFWKIWRESRGTEIRVLAMSEPYALTTLMCYAAARLFFGGSAKLYCYALQNINKKFSYPIALVEKLCLHMSEALLSLGREQSAVAKSHSFCGKIIDFPLWYNDTIFTLPNHQGSELEKNFERFGVDEKHLGKKYKICFAGKVCLEKGITDLIDAILMLSQEFRKDLAVYVIGPIQIKDWDKITTTLGGAGVSLFAPGGLRPEDVALFFQASNLVVVPSRTETNWKEQFGRVIVEAYACGAGVIGSSSGAIPDVLIDNDHQFPERNPKELAQKIAVFFSPTDSYKKTRQEYHNYASEKFSDLATANIFNTNS